MTNFLTKISLLLMISTPLLTFASGNCHPSIADAVANKLKVSCQTRQQINSESKEFEKDLEFDVIGSNSSDQNKMGAEFSIIDQQGNTIQMNLKAVANCDGSAVEVTYERKLFIATSNRISHPQVLSGAFMFPVKERMSLSHHQQVFSRGSVIADSNYDTTSDWSLTCRVLEKK